tara:strand:+ start:1227 stop:1379 length:153 start_codon:yes stop_codon:yes gene_type:complete
MLKIGLKLTGVASTIAGCFIANLLATEAMKINADKGVKLTAYHSQKYQWI